ncbi:response regulator [Paenibacillus sp. H1-7]|uniref:response regulator n=1 Tax=Paenibacillus sp. H1-7 TaxID=2282849 RepID=UPI001EF83CF4|nr:response regulator [Paenibacillus sp. H1-7]ULL14416.1 response regulator [Paenibacillus sp. H1-7]
MIRVLIADDEILVRIGLKTIIPWEQYGFELIGEASNGLEALDMIRQSACDIVLTDIRMPECDGLTLIERLKIESPGTKCLILSSHNDFEYVQKALRLGAVDYVLKLTMEPDELLHKLIALKEQVVQENERQLQASVREFKMSVYSREAKEKRLKDLLVKACSPQDVQEFMGEFGFWEPSEPYYIVSMALDRYQEELDENRFRSERLLNFTVMNILTEIGKKYEQDEFVEIDNGRFAMIASTDPCEMLTEIGSAVQTFLQLSVSSGISQPLESLNEMHTGFLQAEEALLHRFYHGCGGIMRYVSGRYTAHAGPQIEEEWVKLLELRDEEAALNKARDWYLASSAGLEHPDELREQWIQLVHVYGSYAAKLGGDLYSVPLYDNRYPFHAVRSLETLQEIYNWFTGWNRIYFDYVRQLTGKVWRPEIQEVIETIRNRYNENLKVFEIAKEIGFTENYLSVLFKKETGETIMDYLTRIRMDKARELLKDQSYKIYEIAELVGYGDSNYFSKLFKKMEGMYPLEFRKHVLGRMPTSKNSTVS